MGKCFSCISSIALWLLARGGAGAEEFDTDTSIQTVDEVFDRIVINAPDAMFDCRAYYWPSFKSPSYITHSFLKFTYSFTLPTIILLSVPGSYCVATFGEPLLLTWVGLGTKVERKIGSSCNVLINAVNGVILLCEHAAICFTIARSYYL